MLTTNFYGQYDRLRVCYCADFRDIVHNIESDGYHYNWHIPLQNKLKWLICPSNDNSIVKYNKTLEFDFMCKFIEHKPCFHISSKLGPSDAIYHQMIDLDSHDEFHWHIQCTNTAVVASLVHM